MGDQIHSTGRGGAGNIGPDPHQYVDADIVREGVAGESNRPEYSAGRGGAGNMVPSPRARSPAVTPAPPPSTDVVPETATRTADGYENFHTGRGGQGNIHKDKYGGHSKPDGHGDGEGHKEGLLEKAKHALGMDKEKHHDHEPKDGSGLKNETPS